MYPFHRLLALITTGIMVFGGFSITNAGSVPRGSHLVGSGSSEDVSMAHRGRFTSNDAFSTSSRPCWNRLSQDKEVFLITFNEPNHSECVSNSHAETAWMYARDCTNWGSSRNRLRSDHCSEDGQVVATWGTPVVHSSDQAVEDGDVSVSMSGSQNPNEFLISVKQKHANPWNSLSPSILMDNVLMPQTFRFDRMGQELFDGEKGDGRKLVLDFDHQLVMSGKLAHLVPKDGQIARALGFGDVIALLVLALLPEERRIRRLFCGVHQLKLY